MPSIKNVVATTLSYRSASLSGRQQVTGDLLANHLIDRTIVGKRANQVVAISPRFVMRGVEVAAVAVRIPGDIHPMTGPMFAEPR